MKYPTSVLRCHLSKSSGYTSSYASMLRSKSQIKEVIKSEMTKPIIGLEELALMKLYNRGLEMAVTFLSRCCGEWAVRSPDFSRPVTRCQTSGPNVNW